MGKRNGRSTHSPGASKPTSHQHKSSQFPQAIEGKKAQPERTGNKHDPMAKDSPRQGTLHSFPSSSKINERLNPNQAQEAGTRNQTLSSSLEPLDTTLFADDSEFEDYPDPCPSSPAQALQGGMDLSRTDGASPEDQHEDNLSDTRRNALREQDYELELQLNALRPTRKHIRWYMMRVCVDETPSEHEAQTELLGEIKHLYETLLEADPSIVIFPYDLGAMSLHKTSKLPATITDLADVPKTFPKWKTYFPSAAPRPRGGTIYSPVLLGHDQTFDHIIASSGFILKDLGAGLFNAALQAEDAKCVGWLLYSRRAMDIPILAEAISVAIGIRTGLRWKVISLGKAVPIPEDQRVYALHVYVSSKYAEEAEQRLDSVYHHDKPELLPLGIPMRLVSEINAPNPNRQAKISVLRARQAGFAGSEIMKEIRNWEISDLDFTDKILGMSLRTAMMKLRHPSSDNFPLFHSIDRHYESRGIILITVEANVESEAYMTIAGLLPYLRYTYKEQFGEKVARFNRYFTPAAVARADKASWDPIDKCVITQVDVYLENIEKAEDIYADIYAHLNSSVKSNGLPPVASLLGQPKRPPPSYYTNDNVSISTGDQRGGPRRTDTRNPKEPPQLNRPEKRRTTIAASPMTTANQDDPTATTEHTSAAVSTGTMLMFTQMLERLETVAVKQEERMNAMENRQMQLIEFLMQLQRGNGPMAAPNHYHQAHQGGAPPMVSPKLPTPHAVQHMARAPNILATAGASPPGALANG